MVTFHLGAIDLPYEDENTTTRNVAGYLEKKYQTMQTFLDRYGNGVADLMSENLVADLENILVSTSPSRDPLAESMSHVHDLFVALLDNEEMNGVSGMPTRCTLLGISKRFKNRKGDPRASSIDMGNYQAATHAWVSGVLSALPE